MKNKFIKIIEHSRALTVEQKQDLAAVSDVLPEEYKEKVGTLLETFDEHSQARQEYLKEQLEGAYGKLEEELIKDGIEEGKRAALLAKARMQIENFSIKSYAT